MNGSLSQRDLSSCARIVEQILTKEMEMITIVALRNRITRTRVRLRLVELKQFDLVFDLSLKRLEKT